MELILFYHPIIIIPINYMDLYTHTWNKIELCDSALFSASLHVDAPESVLLSYLLLFLLLWPINTNTYVCVRMLKL